MTHLVRPYVVCATKDGRRIAFGPFDTDEQALAWWLDVHTLDVATARVVNAKDEAEAKEWLDE